jgi:RHS repeat-associated protein
MYCGFWAHLGWTPYTPFGKRRGGDDLPFTDRGFLGEIEDASTGLTYLSARYYDPAIAKFISPDPVFNPLIPASLNPYAYAGDDPIGQSDPNGLCRPDYCPQRAGGLRRQADKAKTKKEKAKYEKLARKAEKDEAKRNKRQQKTHKESQRKANQEHFQRARKRDLDKAAKRRPEGFQSSFWCAMGTQKQCDASKDIDRRLRKGGITPGDGLLNGNMRSPLGLAGAKRGRKGPVGRPNGCKSSFVPGTKVLMADGTRKAIEEIKVGDKVVATNPETGKTEAKPVITLISSKGEKRLVQIDVVAGESKSGKAGAVLATDQHPFWVESERRWIDADQLKPGMWLRAGAGAFTQISAIETQFAQKQRVHNLTVADTHTYYVLAGATPVLVHNAGSDDDCIPGYENPGHHDPRGGPNQYNPNKGVLPTDAAEQFQNSTLLDGVRWTKIGSGKKAVYYRYSNDEHGNWRWSGSSNGVDNRGNPVEIPLNHIPIQIRRR